MPFRWPFALRKPGLKRTIVLRAKSFRWAIPRDHQRTIEWREWVYAAGCRFTLNYNAITWGNINLHPANVNRVIRTDGYVWQPLTHTLRPGPISAEDIRQVGDGAGPTGG